MRVMKSKVRGNMKGYFFTLNSNYTQKLEVERVLFYIKFESYSTRVLKKTWNLYMNNL